MNADTAAFTFLFLTIFILKNVIVADFGRLFSYAIEKPLRFETAVAFMLVLQEVPLL